jgi:hypothetical protein
MCFISQVIMFVPWRLFSAVNSMSASQQQNACLSVSMPNNTKCIAIEVIGIKKQLSGIFWC